MDEYFSYIISYMPEILFGVACMIGFTILVAVFFYLASSGSNFWNGFFMSPGGYDKYSIKPTSFNDDIQNIKGDWHKTINHFNKDYLIHGYDQEDVTEDDLMPKLEDAENFAQTHLGCSFEDACKMLEAGQLDETVGILIKTYKVLVK